TAGAFQTQPQGWDDVFVMKLNPAGTEVLGTYIGGGWNEEGLAIALDAAGKIYVGGTASSLNFPVTANAYQKRPANGSVTGFVSVLNAAGSQLLYSTYFGGSLGEGIGAIGVDAAGKIYVTGSTNSQDFPITANAFDSWCGSDGGCNYFYDGQQHWMEDAF